uniref:Uncharacterized protein n=1 Tax=Rhizophora mucronata TaxID=61149 RepID=A0A2P2QVN0_RHIMU
MLVANSGLFNPQSSNQISMVTQELKRAMAKLSKNSINNGIICPRTLLWIT